MAKLPSLQPRLAALGQRIGPAANATAPGADQRRALYASTRWRHARRRFLARNPLCAHCDEQGRVTAAVVVDHKDGHGGDWLSRFWDEAGWQSLCLDCHNEKSGHEYAGYRSYIDSNEGKGVKI
jgi:5-methylcytosine-specific restriction protein A